MTSGPLSVTAQATAAGIAAGRILPGERLAPPGDLSDAERAEWFKITTALPAGFLSTEHTSLLRELCRVTVFAARLGTTIETAMADMADVPPADKRWAKVQTLMRSHGEQLTTIVRLSRALRISKQAREGRDQRSTRRATSALMPWNDWGN
jgi:hypothetical protein